MSWLSAVWRIFPAWVWAILGGVVASIVVGSACYQSGRHDGIAEVEARAMAANLAAQQRDAIAKEAASAERLADSMRTAQLTQELQDAVQSLPDATPSARRLALACARLRDQGADTASIPACR